MHASILGLCIWENRYLFLSEIKDVLQKIDFNALDAIEGFNNYLPINKMLDNKLIFMVQMENVHI